MATLGATAAQILETAVNVGGSPVTILLKAGRVVEMTVANDWSLDSLLVERGVDEVYRVSRLQGQTRVEARKRDQICSLTRRDPAWAARALLG